MSRFFTVRNFQLNYLFFDFYLFDLIGILEGTRFAEFAKYFNL